MTLDTILAALKAERDKIARAIVAIQEGTVTATPARRAAAAAEQSLPPFFLPPAHGLSGKTRHAALARNGVNLESIDKSQNGEEDDNGKDSSQ